MIDVLPGFRKFYPKECFYRNFLFSTIRCVCENFCFTEYDTPTLEPLELYTEKSGEEITNQLFNFTDRGGRAVALRPEATPAVARMIGSKINTLKRPLKWFSIAEQFRYERPQKGRLRSFYQFSIDIFDEPNISAEAEIISLAIVILKTFGLTEQDIHVRLSDRILWGIFLKSLSIVESDIPVALSIIDKIEKEPEANILSQLKSICEYNAEAILKNIQKFCKIRTIDELEKLFEDVPEAQERLSQLRKLLQRIDQMQLGNFVNLDFGIVRGLAYYTGFVFEIFERSGKSRAVAGGGRYDQLIEKFGYPPTPAVGLAFGDVTLQNILIDRQLLPEFQPLCDIFVIFDAHSEPAAMHDILYLRQCGVKVNYALKGISLDKQFKQALNAHYVAQYTEDLHVRLRNITQKKEQILTRETFLKNFQHD